MGKPSALRRHRLLAGVTQIELAREVGVSPSFVSNAERGLIDLTTRRVREFRKAIGDLSTAKGTDIASRGSKHLTIESQCPEIRAEVPMKQR